MKYKIGDKVRINPNHADAKLWPTSVQRVLTANHVFRVAHRSDTRYEPVELDTTTWPEDLYPYWKEAELIPAKKLTIVVMP